MAAGKVAQFTDTSKADVLKLKLPFKIELPRAAADILEEYLVGFHTAFHKV